MKVAFALLVHDNPDQVAKLVQAITTNNAAYVVLHVDERVGSKVKIRFKEKLLSVSDRVHFVESRKCAWGDWSLVDAELRMYRYILDHLDVEYVQFLSGSDFPIKPIDQYFSYLAQNRGKEFIECVNILESSWVINGLEKERFCYYYWEKRPEKIGLQVAFWLQKLIGVRRKTPFGLVPHLGSQFKTLTTATLRKVLDYLDQNPELEKYFKWVWIPDESFFPTVLAKLVPAENMSYRSLVYTQFNLHGRPTVFFDEHSSQLKNLNDKFFCRKASSTASRLYQPSGDGIQQSQQQERLETEFPILDHRVLGQLSPKKRITTFYLDEFIAVVTGIMPYNIENDMPDEYQCLGNLFIQANLDHWADYQDNTYEYLFNVFALTSKIPIIHLTYSQVFAFRGYFAGNPYMSPIFVNGDDDALKRERLESKLILNSSGNIVKEVSNITRVSELF